MSSCVCKISFKSVQVCGSCCKMFRGLTFLGHSVVRLFPILKNVLSVHNVPSNHIDWHRIT